MLSSLEVLLYQRARVLRRSTRERRGRTSRAVGGRGTTRVPHPIPTASINFQVPLDVTSGSLTSLQGHWYMVA